MKKRIIPIVIGVLALAGGLIVGRIWQTNYLAGVTMTKIPVPKVDIPPYTVLSTELFTLQEVPRALLESGAYQVSANDMNGSISVETLLAGLPIARRMAVPDDNFRLADSTLEVISLPADATSTVGGNVRVGEVINIYSLQSAPKQDLTMVGNAALENAPAPKPEVIFVARVPVVAVLADNGGPVTSGSESEQAQPLRILVVAAPPETVQTILDAIAMTEHEGAVLWITLAKP